MKKFIAAFALCAVMAVQSAFAEGIVFSQDGSDIGVNVYVGKDKLDKGDKVSLFILKAGESFENGISEENVYYANAAQSFETAEEAEFSLKFADDDAYGVYPVRAAVTKKDGSVEFYDYEFIHVNEASAAAAIEEFNTVTQDDFERLIYKYTNEEIVLNLSKLSLPKDNIADFGVAFVIARDMGERITNLDDIYSCTELGQVVYAFLNGSVEEAEAAVEKYKNMIDSFYDSEAAAEKVYAVFQKLIDKDISAEKFKDNMIIACRLSYLQDVSNEEMAAYMSAHSQELGIDTDYMNRNNVSMLEAARYLDKNDAVKYKDGMGEAVKKAVDDIVKKRSSGNTSKGSGGSSGGGSSAITYAPTAKPSETPGEPTKDTAVPYNDIAGFEWAQECIVSLTDKGIVNGTANGRFEPERNVFREEFAKMISVAFGFDGGDNEERFSDSKIGDWHYPYISAAAEAGIVSGTGNGLFGVGNIVSRQDAAVMCHRIMIKKNKLPMYGMKFSFADTGDISDYAAEAVSALESAGIIKGFEDGSFKPNEGITRAQAAVIISRLIDFFEQEAK